MTNPNADTERLDRLQRQRELAWIREAETDGARGIVTWPPIFRRLSVREEIDAATANGVKP